MIISSIFSIFLLVLLFLNASSFRLPLVKYPQYLHVSPRLTTINRNRNLRLSKLVVLKARSFSQNGADFELDLDDFDQILESITVFKQVYGDCEIPLKFEVPEEPRWPSTLHGFRLGRRLNSLQSSNEFMEKHPEKVQQLARIGWDPYSMKLVEEWSTLVDCLVIYKNIYGDLRVPAKFIVPDADPWPRAARNAKLGVRVAAIRSAGRYVKENPARKIQLDDMGFEWRIRDITGRKSAEEDKFQLILQALQLYKTQHQDDAMNVPNNYVIPNSPPWPEKLYGMKLGNEVQLIRMEGKYVKNHADRAQQLNGIGFSRGKSPRTNDSGRRFETIYSALRVYRDLYGDLLVPRSFVVPSQLPWPEAAWGVNLGVRVTSIRSQSTFVSNSMERRALLDELGFCWEMRSEINRRARKKVKSADLSAASIPSEHIALTSEEHMYDADTLHLGESDSLVTQAPEELEPIQHSRDAKEKLDQEAEELAEFERELRRLFGDRMDPANAPSHPSSSSTVSSVAASGQHDLQAPVDDTLPSRRTGKRKAEKDFLDDDSEKQDLEVNKTKRIMTKERQIQRPAQEEETDEKMVTARRLIRSLHSPLDSAVDIPDRLRIPQRTYEEGEGRVAPFNPSRIFEPQAYREVIAAKTRRERRDREASTDPGIREHAHFEGYLNSEQFNDLMARPVDPQVVLAMKQEGYRIMDFGRFRFDDILQALNVYRAHNNDINVPQDFVITEQLLSDMRIVSSSVSNHNITPLQDHAHGSAAYWGDLLSHSAEHVEGAVSSATQSIKDQETSIAQYDPRFAGMQLGEAVASLRIGDADGLEDVYRRSALDSLGFDWGDKRRHLRFRFIPLLLGLRIYRHLYGFPLVRPDFKVPDEKTWPYWMAGMPLGEWAAAARIQQEILREHYPQRVAMLDALEFLWWIPPPADMPARYYKDIV